MSDPAQVLRDFKPSKEFFVHLNHTTRLLWDASARRDLERKGFGIPFEGERFPL